MERKWVLVADGQRAKLLKKEGNVLTHVGPTHHKEESETEKDKGHHQPGAMQQGGTQAKHVYAPHTDWHNHEAHVFAVEIAKLVNKSVEEFDKFVVIAPPHTLGELRKEFSATVRAKVVSEIDKDLTKLPINDLLQYVSP